MKLIAALGNIGDKYTFNRHNIGFMAADYWAVNNGLSFKQDNKLKSLVLKQDELMLIKPVTFMNLSGEAISAVMNYYKIAIEDLLVIYDDLSIDLGRIRFRAEGSHGGHNGIKSIIQHLGSTKFDRLKIGIGPQPSISSENFVLQNFSKEQEPLLKETLKKSVTAVEYYLKNDIYKAQNMYN